MSLLTTLVLAGSLSAGLATPSPDTVTTRVRVDSARHEVVITTGPFDLANMPPMENHAMMDHGASHDTPVHPFDWPVDGWFRGFRIEVLDAEGNPLPRHIMHHMIMVNFERRQLLYRAAERLMGVGQETADAELPKTIGVPLSAGTQLGYYVAWHNDTGKDLHGVSTRITLLYTPSNQAPRPLSVMPLYMDVNLNIGGTNTFDIPPGRSEKSFAFTPGVKGRLLGVSGHLHDYGVEVRLEEVGSGKVIARVAGVRDSAGKVSEVERNLFGVRGRGLLLRPDREYRVVGVYDNPTGETLINGAMASMVGLFAPDRLNQWPDIDPADPEFRKDLASLETRGLPAETDHQDQHHNH